jgi:hypothetical protein
VIASFDSTEKWHHATEDFEDEIQNSSVTGPSWLGKWWIVWAVKLKQWNKLMDFSPSEASTHSTSEIAAATHNFWNPLLVEDLSRFSVLSYLGHSHVMFISLCLCSYYLINRYHVPHEKSDAFCARSLLLTVSRTFYDEYTTRLKHKQWSYLVYKALFVRPHVVTDVSVLSFVFYLTVTADQIAYL